VTVPPLCCFPLQHLQPSTSLSLGFRILQPAPPSEITSPLWVADWQTHRA
jgi:hypothetical protein